MEASSPAPASSTSASTRPDSSTSGCAKPTRGGAPSSTSGSPGSPSTPTSGQLALSLPDESMSSQAASRAAEPAPPASAAGSRTPRPLFGTRCGAALASYDPDSSSSRTSPASSAWRQAQASLLGRSGERFSRAWPRSGMTCAGIAFPLRPQAPRTSVTGCSPSLLPTPRASENEQRTTKRTPSQEAGTHGKHLAAEVVRLLPTPNASVANYGEEPETFLKRQAEPANDGQGSTGHAGTTLSDAAYEWSGASTSPPSAAGKPSTAPRPTLSPGFVGWMMGTPHCTVCGAEWTDTGCPHSVTEFTSTQPGLSGAS